MVQRVIYATGTGAGSMQSALLHSLRQAGTGQSDAHGLGLTADAGLRVLDPDGTALAGVWALGRSCAACSGSVRPCPTSACEHAKSVMTW